MTKEEIIKEAYGEHYKEFEKFIDENGWVRHRSYCVPLSKYFKRSEIQSNSMEERPIKLKVLEDNNGWHVINTVADLPKEKGTYIFTSKKQGWLRSTYDYNDVKDGPEWFLRFSHWREIVHVPNPIY